MLIDRRQLGRWNDIRRRLAGCDDVALCNCDVDSCCCHQRCPVASQSRAAAAAADFSSFLGITMRYDTRCYFKRAQKLTRGSLIYRTEPTTEKWKTEKLKIKKTNMLRSIGKQSGESGEESVPKKKRKGCGGKDLQKRKVLSLE